MHHLTTTDAVLSSLSSSSLLLLHASPGVYLRGEWLSDLPFDNNGCHSGIRCRCRCRCHCHCRCRCRRWWSGTAWHLTFKRHLKVRCRNAFVECVAVRSLMSCHTANVVTNVETTQFHELLTVSLGFLCIIYI